MDSTSQDLYLQKLQEFVQDDDKIVTVSSLASDLGISVQYSRSLINKFVEDERKLKSNELTVTYILSGSLSDDKGRGIFMVEEGSLETKRHLFETKPNEMIYSVQKSNNVDFNIIALVDMFCSTKIREKALKGSVVSKNCIKRNIKIKKLPSPPPPTIKGKSSFFMPKPGKSEEDKRSVQKPAVSPKTEQKSKSGGIADMFKAASVKPSKNGEQSGAKAEKTSNSNTRDVTHKQNGGLAGFLTSNSHNSSKAAANGAIKPEKSEIRETHSENVENQNSIEDEVLEDLMDVDIEEEVIPIKTETAVVDKGSASKKKQEQRKKKRQRDKSQEMPSKKRKRIIERNESDSDDMFQEDDPDDIIVSDNEIERVPSPVQKQLAPKNKKRKAVSKAYEDEEGFIVTKTEYVYETASEDENREPEPKTNIEKMPQLKIEEKAVKPKPKVNDKKKPAKNQATLMNFFKKV